ncbi:HAMP domain-containing histidine kinase [Acidaminobacter sp. JC074]|uniref:sensor histidine kinase n=1 Tax=Acidaminobacter sp. JC074 TaxID=2530199 RepID=UPI001F11666D|nr:HAMP domain-containing sensor histidine kinase [Acidaminobacter sp. JC074]MCH4888386.1 HAMP domain-containing histidine kinase [Acidaminobacter sp. JC074]
MRKKEKVVFFDHDFNDKHFWHHHEEFHRYNKFSRRMPIVGIAFSLFVIYLFYKLSLEGYFLLIFSLCLAFIVIQSLFFRHIANRLLVPLMKLKEGFGSIGRGDYSTRISMDDLFHLRRQSDMRGLIHAFNHMVDQLEKSEQVKDEYEENRKMLIANISHDLKTPMTSIKGYLEIMDERLINNPETLLRYIRIMEKNTDYMNNLIDDLFLYSKLDIDQVKFDFKNVQANLYFEDMMEEFSISFEDKERVFEYFNEIEEDTSICVDNKLLYRAILNIMDNSVKYAKEEGQVYVKVLMENDEDYVQLRIRDNGKGIPPEKLPYIFDRFYRVDSERTKSLESTGLGLAITKELLTSHNGQVSASNHEEGGAEFVLLIPIIKEEGVNHGQDFDN